MPNNQQKEEVKCTKKRCKKCYPLLTFCPTGKHDLDEANNKCYPMLPESMVTTLEEDRKLLEEWEKYEGDKYHATTFFNDDMGKFFVVENLLAAKERVVRAECAEIVNKIEKRIEGDRTVRLGFVLSEIDEAKSKILNNSPL